MRILPQDIPVVRGIRRTRPVPRRDMSSPSNIETAHNEKRDAKFRPFVTALSRMNEKDQGLLLHMASKMGNRA